MAPRRNGGDLTQDDANEALVLDNLDLNVDDLDLNEDGDDNLDLDAGDDAGDDDGGERQLRSREPEGDDETIPRRGEAPRGREAESRVTHKPLPRSAEVHPDGKGNLVNAQGVIVARAGKEARLYQESRTATSRADVAENAAREITNRFNELVGHARTLLNENNQYKARDTQLQQFGLKPDEQMRAYQIFTELRDKPEEALRKILTRATASGIDLAKLGVEGGSNTKAVVDLLRGELNQALEPLKQRTTLEQQREQQQREAETVRQNAANEVNQFLTANPEAKEYLPVLQSLVADPRTRGMTLPHLWAEVKLNLLQNPQTQQRRTNSRRMPSGRSAPVGGSSNGSTPRGGDELAPVDMSYDDIIRDILKPEAA
jgi:hypothetical protein